MGNKKLIVGLIVVASFIAIIFILPSSGTREPIEPKEPRPHIIKSTAVRVTPVDDEPGAYVLEYDNGLVEIVHADGTREQLKLETVETPHGSQPIRPNPHTGQRPRTDESPD